MRAVITALVLVSAMVGAAWADDQPPAACNRNAAGVVDWQACLDASPADAPWRTLALINLGSEAFMREDYATAVRYYDDARADGRDFYSDVVFHTFRSVSYARVGRQPEAQADATIVARMLERDPTLPLPATAYLPQGVDLDMIYTFILPVLQLGDAQQFERALASFQARPASDWVGYANRAAVLQELGDIPAALEMSERALAMAPDDPAVLNNHCYILLQAGNAVDALPYCQRAVEAVPDVAAVRHSLASVLAALGRCSEAENELAQARRLDGASVEYQRPLQCQPA